MCVLHRLSYHTSGSSFAHNPSRIISVAFVNKWKQRWSCWSCKGTVEWLPRVAIPPATTSGMCVVCVCLRIDDPNKNIFANKCKYFRRQVLATGDYMEWLHILRVQQSSCDDNEWWTDVIDEHTVATQSALTQKLIMKKSIQLVVQTADCMEHERSQRWAWQKRTEND